MNAWPVTEPDGEATLAYAPDRYAQLALKLLPIAAALAIGWIIVRRPVRAWFGRRWRRIRDAVARRRRGRRNDES